MIAASTMLLPLQYAGIKVDATCILDPSWVMTFHFKHAVTDGTLFYVRGVVESIVGDWTGPKQAFDLATGPSVFHMCVHVALSLGYRELHMVGADFCFDGEQSHAAGVATAFKVDPQACVRAMNGEGNEVLTDGSLIGFRDALERDIARTPGARFIRHGRRGLPVAGTEWSSDAPAG